MLVTDGVFVLTGKEEGNLELSELIKGDIVHRWEDINTVTSLAAGERG